MQDALSTMERAAAAGAAVLTDAFGRLGEIAVANKKPSDFVSDADKDAERAIHAALKEDFPAFGAHLEEAGVIDGEDSDHCWVVDPLDGTTNFLRGIAHFSISIALTRRGRPVAGVVLNPVTGELFAAAEGRPATLNGQPVRVAAERPMAQRLLGVGLPFGDKPGQAGMADEIIAPMKATAGLRRFGSAALDLAYVACGRFDAFWEHDLSPWDVAAGIVLVREAGGIVTRVDGAADDMPFRSILAAPAHSHESVRRLINERTW